MMMLFMIILVVVVAFAAIGLVIGKGYRAKNHIVSLIEKYQGCENINNYNNDDTIDVCELRGDKNNLIKNYLDSVGYSEDEYSVTRKPVNIDSCKKCSYYEVILKVGWNLPFVNSDNKNVLSSTASKGYSGTFEIIGKTDLIRE